MSVPVPALTALAVLNLRPLDAKTPLGLVRYAEAQRHLGVPWDEIVDRLDQVVAGVDDVDRTEAGGEG